MAVPLRKPNPPDRHRRYSYITGDWLNMSRNKAMAGAAIVRYMLRLRRYTKQRGQFGIRASDQSCFADDHIRIVGWVKKGPEI